MQLFNLNGGEALALAATVSVALSARATLRFSGLDLAVLGLASFTFVPSFPGTAPFVGATLAGGWLWAARRDDANVVSLAQLWLTLSAHGLWGRLLFKVVSVPVLRLETIVVAGMGNWLGFGLVRSGAQLRGPSGWSVYILDQCSSFHNLSLAMLVWVALLKLSGRMAGRREWTALAIGALLIVLLNVARILLMSRSEADYQYWHAGGGESLFACLTLAAIALPTLRALFRDLRLWSRG